MVRRRCKACINRNEVACVIIRPVAAAMLPALYIGGLVDGPDAGALQRAVPYPRRPLAAHVDV